MRYRRAIIKSAGETFSVRVILLQEANGVKSLQIEQPQYPSPRPRDGGKGRTNDDGNAVIRRQIIKIIARQRRVMSGTAARCILLHGRVAFTCSDSEGTRRRYKTSLSPLSISVARDGNFAFLGLPPRSRASFCRMKIYFDRRCSSDSSLRSNYFLTTKNAFYAKPYLL